MPGTLVWNFSVSTLIALLVQFEAPFGDRAQLGMQAEEREQHDRRRRPRHAVGALDLDARQAAVACSIPDAMPSI
jgi:hypothetical protein